MRYSDVSNEWLSFNDIHVDKCTKAFHKTYSIKLNSHMLLKKWHHSVKTKQREWEDMLLKLEVKVKEKIVELKEFCTAEKQHDSLCVI